MVEVVEWGKTWISADALTGYQAVYCIASSGEGIEGDDEKGLSSEVGTGKPHRVQLRRRWVVGKKR